MKLVDEKRTFLDVKYSELTMFLMFSENDSHPILYSGSEKDKAIGIAESEHTSAGNLFSRDFLVDNEQQNTNCLSFRALFPISHIHSPHSRQRPALLLILWRIVAPRCLGLFVHWTIQ
jgi:hypothetical protein